MKVYILDIFPSLDPPGYLEKIAYVNNKTFYIKRVKI